MQGSSRLSRPTPSADNVVGWSGQKMPGLNFSPSPPLPVNLFSVHTVYSSLQTYGCFRPSVFILYSPLQTYSVYILYIVLCKPMVASGLQCAYCTGCSPLQTYGGIMP